MDFPGWQIVRSIIADVASSFFTSIEYLEKLPLSELMDWHHEAERRAPKDNLKP